MSDKPHFEVTSAVIRQLGEQLISDEVTALLELVKNAYDADATYAQVVVGSDGSGNSEVHHVDETSRILVVDNGTGMDEDDIRSKWLRISVSEKRAQKRRGITTPKYGRTPQGDKGLGRLSAQRLGAHVKVTSIKEYFPENYPKRPTVLSNTQVELEVKWDLFGEDTPLSEIPVTISTKPRERNRQGTRLEIGKLQNSAIWNDKDARETLVTRLTQLISPFGKDRPFKVTLSISGDTFNFEKIADKIRAVALSTHRLLWTGQELHVSGKLKRNVFATEYTNEGFRNEDYWDTIGHDEGASFFKFLNKGRRPIVSGLRLSSDPEWYLEYSIVVSLDDIAGLDYELEEEKLPQESLFQVVRLKKGELFDPGPFEGELDQFAYQGIDLSSISDAFNRGGSYKEYVKQHAGVRIYRDGFGIRPYGLGGQDWLKLQSGQTSGRSFYGLRPDNVIGYVAISAKANPNLEDKTDREGLIDNPFSRNFFRLCMLSTDRINGVFNILRRKYNEFRKQFRETQISVVSAEQAIARIREASGAQSGPQLSEPLRRLESRIDFLREDVESRRGGSSYRQDDERVRTILTDMRGYLQELSNPVLEHGRNREVVDTATVLLAREIEDLRTQLREFSELAAVGLTVEAFTHNVVDLADRLHRQTNHIRSVIAKKNVAVPELTAYLEYVRGAVAELRLQLRRIVPSLKYVREVRDPIQMRGYFESVRKHYLALRHLEDEGFSFTLVEPFQDFTIRMNRGRFTQITDNLLLNSEFWLREARRRGIVRRPEFFVQASAPRLRLWDNGLGIDPSVEASLFEPFVTTKPRGVGRGLGLFITRQLLDSEGCELHLLPERNQHNRRYIFELNLRGALNGDEQQ